MQFFPLPSPSRLWSALERNSKFSNSLDGKSHRVGHSRMQYGCNEHENFSSSDNYRNDELFFYFYAIFKQIEIHMCFVFAEAWIRSKSESISRKCIGAQKKVVASIANPSPIFLPSDDIHAQLYRATRMRALHTGVTPSSSRKLTSSIRLIGWCRN